jgi:Fe-S cluster assembly protein SufB
MRKISRQFERTLIIADEGSEVMYMEGCTAPKFETATLHSAVVELVALKGAKIQYVSRSELERQRV